MFGRADVLVTIVAQVSISPVKIASLDNIVKK